MSERVDHFAVTGSFGGLRCGGCDAPWPCPYTRRISIDVRLPADLHRRLLDVADDRAVGVSVLTRAAVEHYLNNLPTIEVATTEDNQT
jgi:hypothetical protein